MPELYEILGLNPEQRRQLELESGRLSTISDALSCLVEKVQDSGSLINLERLLPWVSGAVDIAGEVLPPIKAAANLVQKLSTIDDPLTLGMIACTSAYQKAAIESLSRLGKPAASIGYVGEEAKQRTISAVKQKLAAVEERHPETLDNFSLAGCESHAFTRAADAAFMVVASHFGYDEREIRHLLGLLHRRFRSQLKLLLVSVGKDRFRVFREFLDLNEEDGGIRALVHANAARQLDSFYNLQVLQVEPFTLSDVYLDCECGILTSSQIKQRIDPFLENESTGGRFDLLSTIMSRIGTRDFHDVIVIQAPPGAGKSAFTLRLCAHLSEEGLCPVRVRMRDLPLERDLLDSIAFGLEVVDGERLEEAAYADGSHLVKLLNESVPFGELEHLCPYIFILDAWDEISRSTKEGDGFQVRVDRLMSELRTTFLRQRKPIVRVVLTGRPSDVIANGPLLKADTPIHTIRPLRREQLTQYTRAVAIALGKNRVWAKDVLPFGLTDPDDYEFVWNMYQDGDGKLEVLGLPLLLHLSLRVLAKDPLLRDVLGENSSRLYKHLIDQTCSSAGKWIGDLDRPDTSVLPAGPSFRNDLHQLAIAISTLGGEFISFAELGRRCGKNFLQKFRETQGDNPFSRLVIGFFFKAGNIDGIEFLHKSFREYLFAEAIVEMLKEYGRSAKAGLSERSRYWEEFDGNDPRFNLRSRIAPALAAQTLTIEIENHIAELIRLNLESSSPGEDTPLPREQWVLIRDAICDLWDWWGEGVHLRGQPGTDQHEITVYDQPYVVDLVDRSLPQYRHELSAHPTPLRTTGADSNLGVALFLVATVLHDLVPDQAAQHHRVSGFVRRYQFCATKGCKWASQFAPSGAPPNGRKSDYFRNYIRRIQASGWQGPKDFPQRARLRSLHLVSCDLIGIDFSSADLSDTDLSQADMRRADLSEATMQRCILVSSDLGGAILDWAELLDADLTEANLERASLRGTHLSRATLHLTCLRGADLRDSQGLSQDQISAAIGDRNTMLPTGLEYPSTWLA